MIRINKLQASNLSDRSKGNPDRKLHKKLGRKGEAGLGQSQMPPAEAMRLIDGPDTIGENRLLELEKVLTERREAAYEGIPNYLDLSMGAKLEVRMLLDEALSQMERELFGIDLETVADTFILIETGGLSPMSAAFHLFRAEEAFEMVKIYVTLDRHLKALEGRASDPSEDEILEAITSTASPGDIERFREVSDQIVMQALQSLFGRSARDPISVGEELVAAVSGMALSDDDKSFMDRMRLSTRQLLAVASRSPNESVRAAASKKAREIFVD